MYYLHIVVRILFNAIDDVNCVVFPVAINYRSHDTPNNVLL